MKLSKVRDYLSPFNWTALINSPGINGSEVLFDHYQNNGRGSIQEINCEFNTVTTISKSIELENYFK
jgi:hypothetical protein